MAAFALAVFLNFAKRKKRSFFPDEARAAMSATRSLEHPDRMSGLGCGPVDRQKPTDVRNKPEVTDTANYTIWTHTGSAQSAGSREPTKVTLCTVGLGAMQRLRQVPRGDFSLMNFRRRSRKLACTVSVPTLISYVLQRESMMLVWVIGSHSNLITSFYLGVPLRVSFKTARILSI